MRQTSKTTLLAVTLAAMIGGADGSASQQPAGERAVDGELRTLTSLIGAWSGTAVEKDGATRRVDLVFREQLDGRLIEGDYSSTHEHKPLRQVLSITYDSFRREYRCAVVDNIFGLLDVYEGSRTGDRLTLSNARAATTGKVVYRFSLELGSDTLVFDIDVLRPNKDWVRESHVVLRRRSAAQGHHARAVLLEARAQVYDANFRNDQDGLKSAARVLADLTGDADVGAMAHYYLSFAYWALAASQVQARDVKAGVASATLAAEHGRAVVKLRPDDAEAQVVLANALITIAVLDRSRFAEVAGELATARREALRLGPQNPRVVFLDAGMLFNNPPERGGGTERGLARWNEALSLFEKEAQQQSVDPVAPRWGHALTYAWLANAHLNASPPQPSLAEKAARNALRMRPDFWFVSDQVMPRLGK